MTRRNPLDGIDPAVASILGDAERKQRIRRLPRDEQRKARRDAARERTTYEVDVTIKKAVEEIAEREGLSPSSVVILFLADGIRRYRSGKVSFYGLKKLSRSPRYEWVLDQNAVDGVLQSGLGETKRSGSNGTL
ncbi:hypothetical protein [Thermogutta sp.]|uniref:hypothetical protein n=1 Tax=Thermogutta sp. TaxID=1962930 RepID=UPI0032208E66